MPKGMQSQCNKNTYHVHHPQTMHSKGGPDLVYRLSDPETSFPFSYLETHLLHHIPSWASSHTQVQQNAKGNSKSIAAQTAKTPMANDMQRKMVL